MAKKPPGAIVRAPSPAHDPNSDRPSVDERITECMRLMAAGHWNGYPSRVRLAQQWGISEETVRKHSAEAHRRLLRSPEEREELRDTQSFFFERVQREAISQRSAVSGLPDWRAALDAAELVLKYQRVGSDPTPDEAPQIAMKVIVEVAVEESKKKVGDGETGGAPASA